LARRVKKVTREQLIEELWWEIRDLGLDPEDEDLFDLLREAYTMGYNDVVSDDSEVRHGYR